MRQVLPRHRQDSRRIPWKCGTENWKKGVETKVGAGATWNEEARTQIDFLQKGQRSIVPRQPGYAEHPQKRRPGAVPFLEVLTTMRRPHAGQDGGAASPGPFSGARVVVATVSCLCWARCTSCSRRGPSMSSSGLRCAKSLASVVKPPDVTKMPPAASSAVTSPRSSRVSLTPTRYAFQCLHCTRKAPFFRTTR